MKKAGILILYIILFWIVLPGGIVISAIWFEGFVGIRRHSLAVPGILLLCFALPMLAISIIQFRRFSGKYPVSADPPEVFIRTGLYAVWRHPIYLFYTLALTGAAMVWGSMGMLLFSIPVFILLESVYIFIEEKILVRRFGDSYVQYRKKTPLVIPRFYFWLKIPFWFLNRIKFRYSASGRENIPDSPPFFLVSSHRNYLDPFYLAQALPYPIRYITTFEMYRSSKTRWFFRALDCIPKKRYLNDVSTGREILKALKEESVIGVFPEGERMWTGAMNRLKPETLNLFHKFSNIPILPVRLHGNFFAWPRWGKGMRSARVRVEFGEPVHIDPAWDLNRVEDRLREAIYPGDLDHPDFFCRSIVNPANLEIVIYRCPLCRSFDGIETTESHCKCRNCEASLEMDKRYRLSCRSDDRVIEGTLDEVYQAIRIGENDLAGIPDGVFPRALGELLNKDERLIAFSEDMALYSESFPGMEKLLQGCMMLTPERIVCVRGTEVHSIMLENVSSLTTESNFKLQVYDGRQEVLYQLVFGTESVLKWQDFIACTMEKEFNRIPNLR